MRALRIGSALLPLAWLFASGCARPSQSTGPVPVAACPAQFSPLVRATLYFGRGLADGGEVSDSAWKAFLDQSVTPRFPSGLSALPAAGQWRMTDGRIIQERTWVVLLYYPAAPAADSAVAAIAADYKARFRQEAVLQDRALTCTAF